MAAAAPIASFQNRGRDLDAESRGNGRLAVQTTDSESAAVFHRKAKIHPEVQSCDHESRAKQSPLDGEECPEDADVVQLPHPQPFLNPARDERQDRDDQYRSDKRQSYWAPYPSWPAYPKRRFPDDIMTSVAIRLSVRDRF